MPANPRFETYFAKQRPWRAELNALRAILLDCQLTEELKWRQPCYSHDGANIVILSSYKAACVLGFFKGSLLPDPGNRLALPGPNSRAVRMLRFTSVAEITAQTKIIKAFVKAAIDIEKRGLKVDFTANKTITLPEELLAYFKKHPALRRAWEKLTPGRQRGWVIHFDSAKQSATRTARIEKAAPKIMQGLGMHDHAKR
jgi:uncharacterized protein YdeI (YjbR/CyaY-like superfamily)